MRTAHRQLSAELSDIPQASLYRHVGRLGQDLRQEDAGFIAAVDRLGLEVAEDPQAQVLDLRDSTLMVVRSP